MAHRADVDENGQYTFQSPPTVPRSDTTNVNVKFVAIGNHSSHLNEVKLWLNSQNSIYRVRKVIESYVEGYFEKDFVFLRNQNEVLKSTEKNVRLVDILPKLPSFIQHKDIFQDFKARIGFENIGYKKITVDKDGVGEEVMCVLIVFLFEDSELSHWPKGELANKLSDYSSRTFTFFPSSIISAKPSIIESKVEEINWHAIKGDVDKLKVKLKKASDISNCFIDYRRANPLHYAAKNGHLHVCEYLMVNFESNFHMKDARDINNRNPLNEVLMYITLGANKSFNSVNNIADRVIMNESQEVSRKQKSKGKRKSKNISNLKIHTDNENISENLDVSITKDEKQQIPIHVRKRLDVVVYLLTQQSELHQKDNTGESCSKQRANPQESGLSCFDRIVNLPDKYSKYLFRRLQPNFIDNKLIVHFANIGLQLMQNGSVLDENHILRYFEELIPSAPSYLLYPLHLASLYGEEKLVCALLGRKHDITKPDASGYLPFHNACRRHIKTPATSGSLPRHNYSQLINLLYFNEMHDKDLLIGIKLLFNACCRYQKPLDFSDLGTVLRFRPHIMNNTEFEFKATVIKYLEQVVAIKHWVHILPIFSTDKCRYRFLSQAAYCGCIEVVNYLIGSGVNVDVKDFIGRTPLHEAMFKRRYDVVKLLIGSGANPNVVDNRHSTPLHYACKCIDSDVVLDNSSSSSENLEDGAIRCIHLLISEGNADPNIPDVNGRTPIILALIHKRVKIVRWLLENLTEEQELQVDIYGFHVLHYISDLSEVDAKQVLSRYGKTVEKLKFTDFRWIHEVQDDNETSALWSLPEKDQNENDMVINGIKNYKSKNAFKRMYHIQTMSGDYKPLLQHTVLSNSENQQQLIKYILQACPSLINNRTEMFLGGLSAVKNWDVDTFRILCLYGSYSDDEMAEFLFETVLDRYRFQEWTEDKRTKCLIVTISEKNKQKQVALVRYLLNEGASPNYVMKPTVKNVHNTTALEEAVVADNLQVVQLLLEHATVYGCFAALLAALQGNVEMLRMLLKAAELEMVEGHSYYIISPEIIQMRSTDILRKGLLKAACCSKIPTRSLIQCIIDYFPDLLADRKILTRRMVSKVRDEGILLRYGFMFEPFSPLTAVLKIQKHSKKCIKMVSYLLENDCYADSIRIQRKKHIHASCESVHVAIGLGLWNCVNLILAHAGDIVWNCIASNSYSCHKETYEWKASIWKDGRASEIEYREINDLENLCSNMLEENAKQCIKLFSRTLHWIRRLKYSPVETWVLFFQGVRQYLKKLNVRQVDELKAAMQFTLTEMTEEKSKHFESAGEESDVFSLFVECLLKLKFKHYGDHSQYVPTNNVPLLKLGFAVPESFKQIMFYIGTSRTYRREYDLKNITIPDSEYKTDQLQTTMYCEEESDADLVMLTSITRPRTKTFIRSKIQKLKMKYPDPIISRFSGLKDYKYDSDSTKACLSWYPRSVSHQAAIEIDTPLEPNITTQDEISSSNHFQKDTYPYEEIDKENIQTSIINSKRAKYWHETHTKQIKTFENQQSIKKRMTCSENIQMVMCHKKILKKQYVSKIRIFKCKYLPSTVMHSKIDDTKLYVSKIRIFKSKYASSNVKSHLSSRPQVTSSETFVDSTIGKRQARFLSRTSERPVTCNTALTVKQYSLDKIKRTRLVVKQTYQNELAHYEIRNVSYKSSTYNKFVEFVYNYYHRGDNSKRTFGWNFQHLAVAYGDFDILEHYTKITGDDDIDCICIGKDSKHSGVTPIEIAASNMDLDMVQYLLDKGAPLHGSTLFAACVGKSYHNLDIKTKTPWLTKEELCMKKLNMVTFLLKRKCSTEYEDPILGKCLDVVIRDEDWGVADILLEHGAYLNLDFERYMIKLRSDCMDDIKNRHKVRSDSEKIISEDPKEDIDALVEARKTLYIQQWSIVALLTKADDALCEKVLNILMMRKAELSQHLINELIVVTSNRKTITIISSVMYNILLPLLHNNQYPIISLADISVKWSVLKTICSKGYTDVLDQILSEVASSEENVKTFIKNGSKSLLLSLENSHYETAEMLLMNGFLLDSERISGYWLLDQSNDTIKTKNRVLNLLYLAKFAMRQKTSILHAAAAVGDGPTMLSILKQPFGPFLKNMHSVDPCMLAALHNQNETLELCLEKKLLNTNKDATEDGVFNESLAYLLSFIDVSRVLRSHRSFLELAKSDDDEVLTHIEELSHNKRSTCNDLSEDNNVKFMIHLLDFIDVTTPENRVIFLLAVIGKPWTVNVLVQKYSKAKIKKIVVSPVIGKFSFADVLIMCSESNDDIKSLKDVEDREYVLNIIMEYQTHFQLAPLTIKFMAKQKFRNLSGLALEQLTRMNHADMQSFSDEWINIFYKAASQGDLRFLRLFYCGKWLQNNSKIKTEVIHTGIGISLLKNRDEAVDVLLKVESVDILREFKLPWCNKKTCILECCGKVVNNKANLVKSILVLTKNEPGMKERIYEKGAESACLTGSLTLLELLSEIYGKLNITFDDLFLAVSSGYDDFCLSLIETEKYLNLNVIQVSEKSINMVQVACRHNLKKFLRKFCDRLQFPRAVNEVLSSEDKHDLTALDNAKLMGHIDLYLELKASWEVKLKVDNHMNGFEFTGWFNNMMYRNESDNTTMVINASCRKVVSGVCGLLEEKIMNGDDMAVLSMVHAAQEMILQHMKTSYSEYPLIHLMAYFGCTESLRTLLDICDKDVPKELKTWLQAHIDGSLQSKPLPLPIISRHELFTPITASIFSCSDSCTELLWAREECRTVISKNKDTVLHLAVASGRKSTIDMINSDVDSSVRETKNATGYTPAMIAASLGNHEMVPSLMKGLNPDEVFKGHRTHKSDDHKCLLCILDLCIGWSKMYQRFLVEPDKLSDIATRSFWKEDERFVNSGSNALPTILKWMTSSQSPTEAVAGLNVDNAIIRCALSSMGFKGGRPEAVFAMIQNTLSIQMVLSKPYMDELAIEMILNHNLLTIETVKICIQFNRLAIIQRIAEINKDILIDPTSHSLEYAFSLGHIDLAYYILNAMEETQRLERLGKLVDLEETLPFNIKLMCGLRIPGDENWDSGADNLNDSDCLELISIKSPFVSMIESQASLDTMIPNVWLGKELNVDIESFQKKSTNLSPVAVRSRIVTHILQRYKRLISFESPAWEKVEKISIRCLDESRSTKPSVILQNDHLIDTVNVKINPSDKSCNFICSSSVPQELSYDDEMVRRINDITIPDLEDKIKTCIGLNPKITVDWKTILTPEVDGTSASTILTTMNESVWSGLGGLESAIESCKLLMDSIQFMYSASMMQSILPFLQPIKEIRVRFVKTLLSSGKSDFSKVGPVVTWNFTIEEGHLIYDIELFVLYDIIRTCYIGFVNIYGDAIHLNQLKGESPSSKESLPVTRSTLDQQQSQSDIVNLTIDWSSFSFMGKAARKYYAQSLHPEILRIIVTRCSFIHVPMKVNKVEIRNVQKQNGGIWYSNSDNTLRIDVISSKSSDGGWKIESLDSESYFTVFERQQLLNDDMSYWHSDMMIESRETLPKLQVSESYIKELVLCTTADGLSHLVSQQSSLEWWILNSFVDARIRIADKMDVMLRNCGNCWPLGTFKLPYGLWKLLPSDELHHTKENSTDIILQYTTYSMFSLVDKCTDVLETKMLWRLCSFGTQFKSSDNINLVSFNDILYFAPDSPALLRVLHFIPRKLVPIIPSATEPMSFNAQGFHSKDKIHECELLSRCISASVEFRNLDSSMLPIHNVWKKGLELGTIINFDMESLRESWGKDNLDNIYTAARSMLECLETIAHTQELRRLYMDTIDMIIIKSDSGSKPTIHGKKFNECLDMFITSSSIVHIELTKSNDPIEVGCTFRIATAYLRSLKLKEKLDNLLKTHDLSSNIEVKALREPSEFQIYMANSFCVEEIFGLVIPYIMSNYADSRLILLQNTSKIYVDPNNIYESSSFINFKDDTLFFKVPVYVPNKLLTCVEHFLAKYNSTYKKNLRVLFEHFVVDNRRCYFAEKGVLVKSVPSYTVGIKNVEIQDNIVTDTFSFREDFRYRYELGHLEPEYARTLSLLNDMIPRNYLYTESLFCLPVLPTCQCQLSVKTVSNKANEQKGNSQDVNHFQMYVGGTIFKLITDSDTRRIKLVAPDNGASRVFRFSCVNLRKRPIKVLVKAGCDKCGSSCVIKTHLGTFGHEKWLPLYFLPNQDNMAGMKTKTWWQA